MNLHRSLEADVEISETGGIYNLYGIEPAMLELVESGVVAVVVVRGVRGLHQRAAQFYDWVSYRMRGQFS